MLHQWAIKWGVSAAALADLQREFGMNGTHVDTPPAVVGGPKSEAAVQNLVRLEASAKGLRMWRNNVGALKDDTGRVVRYGLANDSVALNRAIKSGDLIGVRPVLIGQHHVGSIVGQFVSRECKPQGWQFKGTEHEYAQLRWAELICSLGGDAGFATNEGSL